MAVSFPIGYDRPVLLCIHEAGAAGWTAKCVGGASPDQTQIICTRGSSGHLVGTQTETLFTPEQLRQGL